MCLPMSGPGGVCSLLDLERRVASAGGLARMRSIPSGNVTLRSSREMVWASIGSLESQSCMASGGRRCGNWSLKYAMQCEAAVCASGSMSTQSLELIA
jgi:hypothetical protein